jgi:hypothetical protein
MVGADGHSHAPSPEAIEMVVDAFRTHGILLHIDSVHTEIPDHRYISFELPNAWFRCDPDEVDFYALKAQYFKPKGNRRWHYAIFGHFQDSRLADPVAGFCGPGGVAELPGDDFIVAQSGIWAEDPTVIPQIRDLIPFVDGGTFMHELGHNLGLYHGGPFTEDGMNYKPNYISVMNGIYSFGIRFAAVPGSTVAVGRRLDYSPRALPPLDESHLDETVGVQGDTTDIVSYVCLPPGQVELVEGAGPAQGPIDWNCNGVIESDVAQDIDVNFLSGSCKSESYPCYRILTSYDDWSHIQRWIRTPAYVSGTIRPQRLVE